MINPKNPILESRLYKLPFEAGTLKLSFETLNGNSEFRIAKGLLIKIRKISYHKEFLTLGIKLDDEKEEKVYLSVMYKCLLVSCSVDTDESYLSRYAYFALHRLMSVNDYYNFERFYWPDFFTSKNGQSKYLSIINDRNGMDISFKPDYSFFLKPSDVLLSPASEPKFNRPLLVFMDKEFVVKQNNNGIGFCLADTFLKSWHSNHYPFLIPYSGILTLKNNSIKSFTNFITNDEILETYGFTPVQNDLYNISMRMRLLAPVLKAEYNCTKEEIAVVEDKNLTRRKELFTLWQDAIPFLTLQPYTHHYYTYGLRNIRKKPSKMVMIRCIFAYDIPKICFLWKDRGEYFELSYRFKIGKKIMIPSENNTIFFINEETNPMKFYLFEAFSDCITTSFFAKHRFKIFVLKAHYEKFFRTFHEELAKIYEFI